MSLRPKIFYDGVQHWLQSRCATCVSAQNPNTRCAIIIYILHQTRGTRTGISSPFNHSIVSSHTSFTFEGSSTLLRPISTQTIQPSAATPPTHPTSLLALPTPVLRLLKPPYLPIQTTPSPPYPTTTTTPTTVPPFSTTSHLTLQLLHPHHLPNPPTIHLRRCLPTPTELRFRSPSSNPPRAPSSRFSPPRNPRAR